MGWIGDTFKALLGLDEEQRAYRESLAAAERLAEGAHDGGAADLAAALGLLGKCLPEDCPGPHFAYRRERTLTEVHLGLARAAAAGLSAAAGQLAEHYRAIEDARRHAAEQIEALRARVTALEAEGSLISAREERRRLEGLERESAEPSGLGDDRRERRAEALAGPEPAFRRHREAAAAALASLRQVKGLTAEDAALREKFAEHYARALAGADELWKQALADLDSAPSAPAAGPAPGPTPRSS